MKQGEVIDSFTDSEVAVMGRFSLGWLFVATAAIACALFAVLNPNVVTASAANLVVTACLAVGIVIVLRYRWQAPFAIGFVAASLVYLAMSAGTGGWGTNPLGIAAYQLPPVPADPMAVFYRETVISRTIQLALGVGCGCFAQWIAWRDSQP